MNVNSDIEMNMGIKIEKEEIETRWIVDQLILSNIQVTENQLNNSGLLDVISKLLIEVFNFKYFTL